VAQETVLKNGQAVRLRPATIDDAAELIRAVDSVAREMDYFLRSRFVMAVEEEQAVIARAREQGSLIVVALLAEELVGWANLKRGRHEFLTHTVELGMGVVRGHRGLGIGTALIDYALKWAARQGFEKVNLGVRASNERARALYRKCGFVEEGYRVREIKDLYGSYHDSVEMAYFVPQAQSPGGQERGDGQDARVTGS
jgi:RimJ/RimL family protein N-acetyltransferase